MPLIDGDEFGAETEADDGDVDFLGMRKRVGNYKERWRAMTI